MGPGVLLRPEVRLGPEVGRGLRWGGAWARLKPEVRSRPWARLGPEVRLVSEPGWGPRFVWCPSPAEARGPAPAAGPKGPFCGPGRGLRLSTWASAFSWHRFAGCSRDVSSFHHWFARCTRFLALSISSIAVEATIQPNNREKASQTSPSRLMCRPIHGGLWVMTS